MVEYLPRPVYIIELGYSIADSAEEYIIDTLTITENAMVGKGQNAQTCEKVTLKG